MHNYLLSRLSDRLSAVFNRSVFAKKANESYTCKGHASVAQWIEHPSSKQPVTRVLEPKNARPVDLNMRVCRLNLRGSQGFKSILPKNLLAEVAA